MKVTDASRPQSHSEEPAKACQKNLFFQNSGNDLTGKSVWGGGGGGLKYAPPAPSPLLRGLSRPGFLKSPFFCVYSGAFIYLAQFSKKKGVLERKSYID